MRRGLIHPAVVGLLVLLAVRGSAGQTGRYDLGQRLQRFEQAWQQAPLEMRPRSTAAMERAVQSFFTLRLADAAEHIDLAFLSLTPDDPPLPEWAVRKSLMCRLCAADVAEPALQVALNDAYPGPSEVDPNLPIRLSILNAEGVTMQKRELTFQTLGAGAVWNLEGLPAGAYRVACQISGPNGWQWQVPGVGISRIENLDSRLAAAQKALEESSESRRCSWHATAAHHLRCVERMQAGDRLEVDYPANRLLGLAEQYIAAKSFPIDSVRQADVDHWLVLTSGLAQVTVRARVPEIRAGLLPVLLLFHGAGGSENMFFETYGAGRLVDLAGERGWLVVAPRQELLGLALDVEQMVEQLSTLYPVDRQRLFLVGHSMGAMQVVRQAVRHAEIVRAAAALGGGRRPHDAAALRTVPFFIGAGSRDFGRSGARQLAREIERVGGMVCYRDYPDVEHMVVVQAAADDLFAFLDEQAVIPVPNR